MDLAGVDRLQFSDKSLALPSEAIAAQAYRIYKAAFDRTPDFGGLGYWIEQMSLGASLQDVSRSFIESAEFYTTYGSVDDRGFIELLYQNVLDRTPDYEGYYYWLNLIEEGKIDRVGILASFSESAENISNVAPIISSGILYEPWLKLTDNMGYDVTIFDGNTITSPEKIALNSHDSITIFETAGGAGDREDYYEFTVDSVFWADNNRLTVSLSGLSDDLDLALYSADGTILGESFYAGATSESIKIDLPVGETTYIVGVQPMPNIESQYILEIVTENLNVAKGSSLLLEVVDIRSVRSGGAALEADGLIGFDFSMDGRFYSIFSDQITEADTYFELAQAIQVEIDRFEALNGLRVTLGGEIFVLDSGTGMLVEGATEIIIENSVGYDLNPGNLYMENTLNSEVFSSLSSVFIPAIL